MHSHTTPVAIYISKKLPTCAHHWPYTCSYIHTHTNSLFLTLSEVTHSLREKGKKPYLWTYLTLSCTFTHPQNPKPYWWGGLREMKKKRERSKNPWPYFCRPTQLHILLTRIHPHTCKLPPHLLSHMTNPLHPCSMATHNTNGHTYTSTKIYTNDAYIHNHIILNETIAPSRNFNLSKKKTWILASNTGSFNFCCCWFFPITAEVQQIQRWCV